MGLKISLGEMSFIIDKFLSLVAGVNEEKIPEIRKIWRRMDLSYQSMAPYP